MAEKDLGKVSSPSGKDYHVQWNDSSGLVYVKRISGWLETWTRCDAKARTAGDAMDVAAAFVRRR
jgi:hypothetical protein